MSRPQQKPVTVVDRNGLRGTIHLTTQPQEDGEPRVLIQLDGGQKVLIPADALVERKDGSYFVPLNLMQFDAQPQVDTSLGVARSSSSSSSGGDEELPPVSSVRIEQSTETLVVPIIIEELQVEKRKVETGGVRITKKVHEREEVFDEPLVQETVDVKRVAVNRVVDGPPPIRYAGDTMIVPLLEEVLVVEKRLMLKEELHISKQRNETRNPQQFTLRSEEAIVERISRGQTEQPSEYATETTDLRQD